jgi:hypothetical protein
VKTGCNLAESSMGGYGSRRAVSQMMMVTIMKIYVMNLYCILVMWHENKYILSYILAEII